MLVESEVGVALSAEIAHDLTQFLRSFAVVHTHVTTVNAVGLAELAYSRLGVTLIAANELFGRAQWHVPETGEDVLQVCHFGLNRMLVVALQCTTRRVTLPSRVVVVIIVVCVKVCVVLVSVVDMIALEVSCST